VGQTLTDRSFGSFVIEVGRRIKQRSDGANAVRHGGKALALPRRKAKPQAKSSIAVPLLQSSKKGRAALQMRDDYPLARDCARG